MMNLDRKNLFKNRESIDQVVQQGKENPEATGSTQPASNPTKATQTQQQPQLTGNQRLADLKQQAKPISQQPQLTDNQQRLANLKQKSPQTSQIDRTPKPRSASL